MDKETICRFCKSKNTIRKGFRKTQNRGKIQKYRCRDCNRFFVLDEGFLKMKNNPQKITLCLDLFYKGVSTRQVQQHLKAFYPHNASWVSIYKWVVKYSKQISKFTDTLKLQVGKELQIDEMEIGSKKSQYKGWFIDSIDTKTRFMVASEFVKSRNLVELKYVLQKAKDKTENQFQIITSDGLPAYPQAIQRTFMLKGKMIKGYEGGVIHTKKVGIKGEGFNIMIERLHNSVRQRIKIFRGFHGSVESANALMKGWEIHYNFIRNHLALGKTPSELATDIILTEDNKWLELIKMSKK
jgi:transposase-like protein